MDALASKKSPPQTTKNPGCGGTPTTVGVHKALAFNTLLSSQKTDTHHQNPHGPLRGNPSNLPANPSLSIRPSRDRIIKMVSPIPSSIARQLKAIEPISEGCSRAGHRCGVL